MKTYVKPVQLLLPFVMTACSHQSYEMEELAEDVLKSKDGVEIQVRPIPKEGK